MAPFLVCWRSASEYYRLCSNWSWPAYQIHCSNPYHFCTLKHKVSLMCLILFFNQIHCSNPYHFCTLKHKVSLMCLILFFNWLGESNVYLLTGSNLLPKWWDTFWSCCHMRLVVLLQGRYHLFKGSLSPSLSEPIKIW